MPGLACMGDILAGREGETPLDPGALGHPERQCSLVQSPGGHIQFQQILGSTGVIGGSRELDPCRLHVTTPPKGLSPWSTTRAVMIVIILRWVPLFTVCRAFTGESS